ncbi:MAG: hypothetical protein SGARI_001727 [Bacillariaceae sp.]
MSYCKAVLKEGSSLPPAFQKGFFDPGIPTLLLYDSEIVVAKGKEHLESMKLSPKTENRRVFAACCGTPIAIAPDHQHLNLNCKENEVPFPSSVIDTPTLIVHASHIMDTMDKDKEAQVSKKHPTMKIIPTVVAPLEILKIINRLLLLLVLGDRGPGQGLPMDSDKTLGIGIESVAEKMKMQ